MNTKRAQTSLTCRRPPELDTCKMKKTKKDVIENKEAY